MQNDYLLGIFIFFISEGLLHVCLYIVCIPGVHRDQKLPLYPLEPELRAVHAVRGCWELYLYPVPLQQQQVLLDAKPCLLHPANSINE